MTERDPDGPKIPDVQELADSMLLLHGGHDHDEHGAANRDDVVVERGWAKARSFTDDPGRAAEIRAATGRDQHRYLNAGLTPIECRRCGTTVSVKKLGPEYTAVQWNSTASRECAYFAELRHDGGDSSRTQSCPNLTASIRHAVAEGLLEETTNPD